MNFNTQNFGAMHHMMNARREIETSHNDPIFQALVRRKNGDSGVSTQPIQEFPQEDIDALESFCKQHGILGFNFGRMNPRTALNMLKSKMGMPTHTEVTVTQTKKLLNG